MADDSGSERENLELFEGIKMLETDATGQKQLDELVANREDEEIFNDWERKFITDMIGKKYSNLSKHQKAVVTRLYTWFKRGE